MKKFRWLSIFLGCSVGFLLVNTLFYFKSSPLKAETSLKTSSNSTEEPICLKCHKGEYSLQNMVKKLHITTGEELFKVLRKGPKASIHRPRTDEQIEQAIKYLSLPFKKE